MSERETAQLSAQLSARPAARPAGQRAPIIVLGMHRSGTTLLTKMLEGLGVFTGRGGGSNREAVLFQHVNKWIFAQVNATSVRPEDARLASTPELLPHMDRVLHAQIRGIGAARYAGLGIALRYRDLRRLDFPWAWKDPRNSYTAGLWKRVFPGARLLHIHRHPLDVASSLKKREEARLARFRRSLRARFSEAALVRQPIYCRSVRLLDPLEGVKLWEQYVAASFASCSPFEADAMHCRYETLLERPEEMLGEVAEFVGLPVSAGKISETVAQVNPKRGLAHRTDPAMTALAAEIAHLPLVQKLGYSGSHAASLAGESSGDRSDESTTSRDLKRVV